MHMANSIIWNTNYWITCNKYQVLSTCTGTRFGKMKKEEVWRRIFRIWLECNRQERPSTMTPQLPVCSAPCAFLCSEYFVSIFVWYERRVSTKYQVPSIKYQVSSTKYQVPSTKYLVLVLVRGLERWRKEESMMKNFQNCQNCQILYDLIRISLSGTTIPRWQHRFPSAQRS